MIPHLFFTLMLVPFQDLHSPIPNTLFFFGSTCIYSPFFWNLHAKPRILKVLVPRTHRAASVHSGDRNWSTMIECISTRGIVLRPMIIFAAKKIMKGWPTAYPEAYYGVSNNGWTDDEHGYWWLTEVFDPQTRHYGGRRLLIIDGHSSHITVKFITYCWANEIVPLCLPPHTTHFLQPLDVGLFGPLSIAYRKELEARNRLGLCFSDKIEFLRAYRRCRSQAFTQYNIMQGWAKAG